MSWSTKNDKLTAQFKFEDFAQAFSFMTEVAIHAEKQNHHPTWANTYDTVSFELSTHDAGNKITEKDQKLAEIISKIYLKYISKH